MKKIKPIIIVHVPMYDTTLTDKIKDILKDKIKVVKKQLKSDLYDIVYVPDNLSHSYNFEVLFGDYNAFSFIKET